MAPRLNSRTSQEEFLLQQLQMQGEEYLLQDSNYKLTSHHPRGNDMQFPGNSSQRQVQRNIELSHEPQHFSQHRNPTGRFIGAQSNLQTFQTQKVQNEQQNLPPYQPRYPREQANYMPMMRQQLNTYPITINRPIQNTQVSIRYSPQGHAQPPYPHQPQHPYASGNSIARAPGNQNNQPMLFNHAASNSQGRSGYGTRGLEHGQVQPHYLQDPQPFRGPSNGTGNRQPLANIPIIRPIHQVQNPENVYNLQNLHLGPQHPNQIQIHHPSIPSQNHHVASQQPTQHSPRVPNFIHAPDGPIPNPLLVAQFNQGARAGLGAQQAEPLRAQKGQSEQN